MQTPSAPTGDRRAVRAMLGVAAVCVLGFIAQAGTQATTRNFLWKTTNSQGAIYLVGSVHLLTKDYYPLSPALDVAFKDADLLVEEVDVGQMLQPDTQLQMVARAMLPAGQTLNTMLSAPTLAMVSARVEKLGMPLEPLRRFKPWFLALTLLGLEWQGAGFDPNLGLDKHFYDRAKSEGKPVQGLETFDFQVSRFDDMTPDEQDRLLAQTLKELDTQKASVTKLADAWKSGDAQAIEAIVLADLRNEPRMYQRLLVERNRNWLPAIEALFARPGRAFVVVGAAHLVGPDGLLAMLRAKGYRVEQM